MKQERSIFVIVVTFTIAIVSCGIEEQPHEESLDLGDGIKMEFVLIPAGKYMMGSPTDEKDHKDSEGRQRIVNILNPYYLGIFEVTQEQYVKIIGMNPSNFKGKKNPVENVSWEDAKEFCKRMSEKTSRDIRLPSEAEWEYACRAGSTTPIHPPRKRKKASPLTKENRRRATELIKNLSNDEFDVREQATKDLIAMGSDVVPLLDAAKVTDPEVRIRLASVKSTVLPQPGLDSVAWFDNNSNGKTHPVGEKEPNMFGLHDMLGNVWELVEDDWHNDYSNAPSDGSAWINIPRGHWRVLRGGSCHIGAWHCRSACRDRADPKYRNLYIGFRVVCRPSNLYEKQRN